MSAPTPRTDAAWSASFEGKQLSAGQTARALRDCSQQLERELIALTAERDQLRIDRYYNHKCINRLASSTGTLGEKSEKVVEVALSTIDQLRAEVERRNDIINRASVQFFHDGSDGETAAKMLTVLNEAKA
jgi:hypothetical protein